MQQAQRLFVRLTEVEKINIRAASRAGLEYLGDTVHRSDLPLMSLDERATVLEEVQALCALETAAKASDTGFNGVTWKF